MSKEDGFEFKRMAAYMNAFGIKHEEKMRKYWTAFKDSCKGRDVPKMRRVMEENVSGMR